MDKVPVNSYPDEVARKWKAERDVLEAALLKIYDPKKYHHVEPDDYTQAACFQFVAQEALKAVGALDATGEERDGK